MKTRLINLWEGLRSSYWFVPGLLVVLGILLAVVATVIDLRWGNSVATVLWEIRVSPEGARTVLSTAAGAILSLAAVSFSITIVTLTLASSQFGPRLIRNFVRSTPTQLSLGGLLSTFVYCLIILGNTRSGEDPFFVPFFSLGLGFLLTLMSIFLFVFFLHHVATSIQAENVIARVGTELTARIQDYFPAPAEESKEATAGKDDGESPAVSDPPMEQSLTPDSDRGGYLQAIDFDTLICLAEEENLYLHLNHLPGRFLVPGEFVLEVGGPGATGMDDALRKKLLGAVIIGDGQTPEQDYGFSIRQLVEIALRALSPGINDPFTAITCINYLGGALATIAQREMPESRFRDSRGVFRLQCEPVTFEDVVASALDQLRRDGAPRCDIASRLLELLGTLASQARSADRRDVILRHAHLIAEIALENATSQVESDALRARLDRVIDLGGS